MKTCLITYEPISGGAVYSRAGLNLLSRNLKTLASLPFNTAKLREEALARSDKMSVQGVQPKLSAVLKISEGRFEIVDRNGTFILKPQCDFPEVPQNEAVTMTMAGEIGIDVPVHGLVQCKDNDFVYFVKRFDRVGRNEKVAIEDFAQLSGESRETKYDSSMEKVAHVIETYCTFPKIEFIKLFERTLFCFLVGNEDMHLKNFSLIRQAGKVELSPAYDMVNSTIAIINPKEEMALPINGKRAKFDKNDLVDSFAIKQLGLNVKIIDEIFVRVSAALPKWKKLVSASFLSDTMKKKYLIVLNGRQARLGL